MNIYLEAPHRSANYSKMDATRTIFLAGSITGASDWQRDMALRLLPYLHVINPRREGYDILNPALEREQISWEFMHLAFAGITSFYFAPETLAPITMLEYGKQLVKCKIAPWRKTYVCVHPDYKRKNDVLIQTELEQPEWLGNIFYDVKEMTAKIIKDNA